MKESHRKGLASHPDPESCVGGRKAARRSVDRGTRRPAIELRNQPTPGCRRRCPKRKATPGATPSASRPRTLRSRRPCACVETPCTGTGRSQRSPAAMCGGSGREKAQRRTPGMHARGKSDDRVVPAKPPNNGVTPSAEGVEGRRSTKENTGSRPPSRTQSRTWAWSAACSVCGKQHAGPAGTVHRPAAPRDGRPAPEQLLRAQAGSGAGSGRRDVGGSTTTASKTGSANLHRPGPSGDVSGTALEASLHPEGRRAPAAAGDRGSGGQDRAARRGDGSRADLRGGLLGILLWVPAEAAASTMRWMRSGWVSCGSE